MSFRYKLHIFVTILLVSFNNFIIKASCSPTCDSNGSTALGQGSQALGEYSVALGIDSIAKGNYSTALGQSSSASMTNSTALGSASLASGNYSTALGVASNASGEYSVALGGSVMGGVHNSAGGTAASVLGGYNNTINSNADYSTIVGGTGNTINAGINNACAIGSNITVNNTGAFVWSDGTAANATSSGENTFTIYAGEGLFLKKGTTRGKKITDGAGGMALEILPNGKVIQNLSSRKYKKEIELLSNDETNGIYNLDPVKFYYYSNNSGPKEIGLIAEDVDKYYKELVVYNEEGEPESVKYRILPVLMLNELKKLKSSMENLQEKDVNEIKDINELRASIDKLETGDIHEIRASIGKLQQDHVSIVADYKLEIQDLKDYIKSLRQ